jgi:uncharacterized protein (DUF1501 family)
VFLLGGNDSFNMVVPGSTTEYNEYAAARQNLAIAQADLLPVNPIVGAGADYGLHPSMPENQTLFNNGELAIAANVGALVTPTTRNDYINGAVPLPPNLFSHNSQQNFWQSVQAFGAQNVGGSGRMAEILQDTYPGGALPINISLTGANLLQVGEQSTAYNVSAAGVPNINGESPRVCRRLHFLSVCPLVLPSKCDKSCLELQKILPRVTPLSPPLVRFYPIFLLLFSV